MKAKFLKAVVENQVLVVSGEMNCARIFSEKEEYLVKQWISDSLRVKLLNCSRIGVGFSNGGVIFGGCVAESSL